MKNRIFTALLLLVLMVTMTSNVQATSISLPNSLTLVYVNLSSSDDLSRFASTQLPMFAMLDEGLLTSANQAGQQGLIEAGLSFQVLDTALRAGTYYLAKTRPSRPSPNFASFGHVLLNTVNGVLIRTDPSQVDALTQAGAELQAITLDPKPLPVAQIEEAFPDVVEPDPIIQGMIDQVNETQVYTYDRQLAGELPVWVDDSWYIIATRNTKSGIPIRKTTSFVGQHMANDLGLDVEYHVWYNSTNPNVIGEIPGLVNPDDIFIIGAHIDDINGTKGADDNASGSVATLLAADILSQYQWGCTLRFAFWTGEEQGLLGSKAYAMRAHNAGENIRGYLNLDMIAWNTPSSSPDIDIIYNSSMPPTQQLAQLFADVVSTYNINLIPEISTHLSGGSDHSSFLGYGYAAILSIEDQDDFNPSYHTSDDTPANTDPLYFTDFVKASIATYAHMSDCLITSGFGYLDGHVIAMSDGSPINGASVIADADLGHTYTTITDSTGYYTRTLMAGTYSVTAFDCSVLPSTINGIVIAADTVTSQNFIVQQCDKSYLPLINK